LPSGSDFVIVRKHNTVRMGLYFSDYKKFMYNMEDQTSQVTHWMYFPDLRDKTNPNQNTYACSAEQDF